MWVDLLLVSLWGGFVAMDTTAALQIMLSRPMVACSVTGLILGNFPLGFSMGVLLELIYISELPVGAAKFAEGNVGSSAATAVAVLTLDVLPHRPIPAVVFGMILALFISAFGGDLVEWMRSLNSSLYSKILDKKRLTIRDVETTHLLGLLFAFLLGFLLTLITTAIFSNLLPLLIGIIPEGVDRILYPIQGGLLAAGIVFLIHLLWRRKQQAWLLVFGALCGGLLLVI